MGCQNGFQNQKFAEALNPNHEKFQAMNKDPQNPCGSVFDLKITHHECLKTTTVDATCA